jgi:hypothetical protein
VSTLMAKVVGDLGWGGCTVAEDAMRELACWEFTGSAMLARRIADPPLACDIGDGGLFLERWRHPCLRDRGTPEGAC